MQQSYVQSSKTIMYMQKVELLLWGPWLNSRTSVYMILSTH